MLAGFRLSLSCLFQIRLRDYPQPLLAITNVTIAGRMMLAEQEAQERGGRGRGEEGERWEGGERQESVECVRDCDGE